MTDVTGGGTITTLSHQSDQIVDGDPAAHTLAYWTPPGYDPAQAGSYPVLYLLADSDQSWREWQELGRMGQILDNLHLGGQLADMVVVMAGPSGNADVAGLMAAAESAIYGDAQPTARAVAGIGDGASAALGAALADPTTFTAIGSLSGYLPEEAAISQATATALNDTAEVIRFYSGNALDAHYNDTLAATKALESAGVTYQSDGVTPGSGAVWQTWRLNLRDFVSRIFQDQILDPAMTTGNYTLDEPYTPVSPGGATGPMIDDHGIVTFETGDQWADADDVVLWGDWAPNGAWFRIPMTKVGDHWRASIGPLDGFYYWRYEVDAVGYADPADTTPGKVNMESQLWVDPGARTPLLAPAPQGRSGQVDVLEYDSTTFDKTQHIKVWTPVDYDPDRSTPYPVFYLYHGAGQNYASWTEQGRAAEILDNLYVQGNLAPMVVVMPEHPTAFGGSIFADDLFDAVMPLIEQRYNVSTDPAQRALAGLSMGGMGTTQVMTTTPEQFAYYGVFSGALSSDEFSAEVLATMAETTALVEYFVGDADFIPGIVDTGARLSQTLTEHGIDTVNTVVPGPHGFDVWWQGLSDFAPRLFRDDYGLVTDQPSYDLGSVTVGYDSPAAATVTVSNQGVAPTPQGTITLTGPDAGSFQLSTSSFAAIPATGDWQLLISTVDGLPVGTYHATATVTAGEKATQFEIMVEVVGQTPATKPDNSQGTAGPLAPTGGSVATSSVPPLGAIGALLAVIGLSGAGLVLRFGRRRAV
jgi:enterochelin esterase-like enzyme